MPEYDDEGQVSAMGLLSLGGGVLWLLSAAIQLGCIIHVIRTGRPYWWILVIFWFPFLGAVAYLFFEVMPSVGKFDLNALMWRLKSAAQRVAIREQNLEESETYTNRLALADELHLSGQYDRECRLLADGLQGAFKEDAPLLMCLAEAHLEAGRPAEAERVLANANPDQSPEQQLRHSLLVARIAADMGRHAEAEKRFQKLIAKKKNEGPRYYYARFLMRTGRRGEATPILRDILKNYRRGTPVWRFVERRWFYAAKALLKTPQAAATG